MSKIRFTQISEPASPPAGKAVLFLDSADGFIKLKKSDGSVKDLINVDTGGGEFYINVGQTDDNPTYKNINTIKFNVDNFYVTQNSPNTDEAVVNFRGDKTTVSNLSGDEGIFAQKVGDDIQLKSLSAGTNITLSSDGNEITISSTASGGGGGGSFYNIVKHTDDSQVLREINVFVYNVKDFYVTSNPGNTDEAVINLRDNPVAFTKSMIIEDPTASEDLSFFRAHEDLKVLNVASVVRGSSTPSVEFYIKFNSDRTAIGESVLGNGKLASSVTTGNSFVPTSLGSSILKDDWVWVETTQSTGVVDEFLIQLRAIKDI